MGVGEPLPKAGDAAGGESLLCDADAGEADRLDLLGEGDAPPGGGDSSGAGLPGEAAALRGGGEGVAFPDLALDDGWALARGALLWRWLGLGGAPLLRGNGGESAGGGLDLLPPRAAGAGLPRLGGKSTGK